MSDGVELRRYDGVSVRADSRIREQLAEVYADAFAEPPYRGTVAQAREWAAERLVQHLGYPAFGLATAEREGRVLGFGYGLLGADDQWFTQTVRARASAAVAQGWLGGHGELVELAIRSEARGVGLGGRLHDAVVDHLRHAGARNALLVADIGAAPARALYVSRGWHDVAELTEGSRLMGLRLAGDRSGASPPPVGGAPWGTGSAVRESSRERDLGG